MDDAARIVELLDTPLSSRYSWDYAQEDPRLIGLYRLGRKLDWDADTDLDWACGIGQGVSPIKASSNPFAGCAAYQALIPEHRLQLDWQYYGWFISQLLHGEQGALLVASQLVACAPILEAKVYASSQVYDEGRHVTVFARYSREQVHRMYPADPRLKALLDGLLLDRRWDVKFLGMQLVLEAVTLAMLSVLRDTATDPLLHDIIDLVSRDEARHIAFGTSLFEYVSGMSDEEWEQRQTFVERALDLVDDFLVAPAILAELDCDPADRGQVFASAKLTRQLRSAVRRRVIPDLEWRGLVRGR